jgi:hypothetical protein
VLRSWAWEGNVQAAAVAYLARQGWLIRSVADTASRQTGKDIVAEQHGAMLWVSAKGYPPGTPRTRPSAQAGHWFKQAVFDMLAYRGENMDVELAIALPDFPRYRNLALRVNWIRPVARFSYYWVQENGDVRVE